MSTVQVDAINESTTNAGVTVDGVLIKDSQVDGVDVSALNTTVSALSTGITEYDVWQLTSNLTASANPITTFVRPTGTLQTKLGTGMSVSSGIWTFPSTGIWEVKAQCLYSQSADNQLAEVIIYSSDDNFSTEDEIGYNSYRGKSPDVGSGSIRVLLDIQDTANDKVKFTYTDANGSGNLLGESTKNRTSFQFIKISDT
jgi:post-segregation antitoxin (ccd killing protein)